MGGGSGGKGGVQPSRFVVSGIGTGICNIFPDIDPVRPGSARPVDRMVDVEALATFCPRGAGGVPGQARRSRVRPADGAGARNWLVRSR